jgi:RNA polymerase sigma-70 factor (ECF subfamily)
MRAHVDDDSSAARAATQDANPPAAVTGSAPPWKAPKSRVDHAAEAAALASIRHWRPEQALAILATAYGAPITAFALRIVRNPELAYDVRQQVFLEAFQGFDKFAGRSSLWSWLCGIAYHRCLDELRRLRRTNVGDDFDVVDGLMNQPDTTDDAARVAMRRALEHCLGKQQPALRSQLLMRYYLGLSYAEIAEAVGDRPEAVQRRMSRILPNLRECLQKKGFTR